MSRQTELRAASSAVLHLLSAKGIVLSQRTVSQSILELDADYQARVGKRSHDADLVTLESILPVKLQKSLQTGCGLSTVLFSHLATLHRVFAYDDRHLASRSLISLFEKHPMTRLDHIHYVPGPTYLTLPRNTVDEVYDVVVLDGAQGSPIVELEYFHLYQSLVSGSLLILENTHIPTTGLFADVLKEDDMFEYHARIGSTLILRRTDAPCFEAANGGWTKQRYNLRRIHHDGNRPATSTGIMVPMSRIISEDLPFEAVYEEDYFDDANARLDGTSATLTDSIMKGFTLRVGSFSVRFSGKTAKRRITRAVRIMRRMFSGTA